MNNSINFILLILTVSFLSCSAAQKEKLNTLTKKEKQEGWELLFDGKSLDNWKMFNGGEVTGWKIADGILENSGVGSDHGGDIVSKKQYENFELHLEWKVASESNSGVFYHVQ